MAADERIPDAHDDVKMEGGHLPNGSEAGNGASQNGVDMSRDDSRDSTKSKTSDRSVVVPKAKSATVPPQKKTGRQVQLFDHLPNATTEATKTFQVINDCLYGSKHLGSTSDHDVLDCECVEDWRDGVNHACGEDSDCINRLTRMECVDNECNCGDGCGNQRFQLKQYADVSVIKTEKKGFGLRANTDLRPNDFIFEYVGEVINEPTFRRRMMQYDDEGIKHFYFMSLSRNEFIDATKKGNLGRFCNHSCNPNCYVDKWVVGEKLRMGIFAEKAIRAGEELVFNYNVDRYGANPQPCYCGEPNCTGFIGGKTQTERATKLSAAVIEALGIDDDDGWDTAVAKKPRKKKATEDDEEYVNSVEARTLDEGDVTRVMAALMQCKEKWIAVKLLERIQRCDEDRVRNQVVRMHGYQILKATLNAWLDDYNVVLQVLDILYHFPRLTRNKIADSKIEDVVQKLTDSEHEGVAAESARLLEEWSKLQTAYRIPRKKLDPSEKEKRNNNSYEDRRNRDRDDDAPSSGTPRGSSPVRNAPRGPKSSIPQRSGSNTFPHFNNRNVPTGPRRIQQQQSQAPSNAPSGPKASQPKIPPGWYSAVDGNGRIYYYDSAGHTSWIVPKEPAPKQQSKVARQQKEVQDIIDSLMKQQDAKTSTPVGGDGVNTPRQGKDEAGTASGTRDEPRKESWRELPLEKQKKIYENTLFPFVRHVLSKYKNKMPKDLIKRYGKEVTIAMIESDYRHQRVDDPRRISDKHQAKVKMRVKEYFDKAAAKYQSRRKSAKEAADSSSASKGGGENDNATDSPVVKLENGDAVKDENDDDEKVASNSPADEVMSDVEDAKGNMSPRKRKRDDDDGEEAESRSPSAPPSCKRVKDDEADSATATPPPPPPPPPPPTTEYSGADADGEGDVPMCVDSTQDEAAAEEEAERLKMKAEEEALERENEEAMKEFELARMREDDEKPAGVLPGPGLEAIAAPT